MNEHLYMQAECMHLYMLTIFRGLIGRVFVSCSCLSRKGVANRGASVRVARDTEKEGKGERQRNRFLSFQCGLLLLRLVLAAELNPVRFLGLPQATWRTGGQRATWTHTW